MRELTDDHHFAVSAGAAPAGFALYWPRAIREGLVSVEMMAMRAD